MFIPTSRLFFDEITGTGGGGTPYLNAVEGDKITCVIEGYFERKLEDISVIFDAATKTITLQGTSISSSSYFTGKGFASGMDIDITGTVSNNTTFVIASVTDTVITLTTAPVDEPCEDTNIYDITDVTDMDLYFDLIPNLSQKSDFVSATDKETVQRYIATGLDATVATPVFMQVGSESMGWVPDVMSGSDTEAFIEGVAFTDHKQYFKITHVFYMTRLWTKELFQNFLMRTAPAEYQKGGHLKHVCRIDGKFSSDDVIASHTGSIFNQNGITGWFNQNGTQERPEYKVVAIQYQNDVTLAFLDQIDASIVNLVTLSVYSRSGKFVAAQSQFILNHILCPLNEAVYVNTPDTTLLQNIRMDKKLITEGAAAVDGINFGTDYQAITDIQAVIIDANNMAITFKVDYSSDTKAMLSTRSADDRLYAFFVTCQDQAVTTTKGTDRVPVLADFRCADYDLREPAIFGLLDYFHCFTYPNYGVFEVNKPCGYQGDPAYTEIGFWIETAVVDQKTPTLQQLIMQIVATKTGSTDFVIEEKKFDISTIRKLNDKQTINLTDTRGFILPEGSPWNRCNVIRYAAGDSGTKIAYKLQYGYVLRYEEWIQVVASAEGNLFDIFKNVEDVVQAWKRYSTGNGWELQLRVKADVQGYYGVVTKFKAQEPFTILQASDAPQDGPTFKSVLQFFNEEGVEVPGILHDAVTRVVAKFFGDPTVFPAGMTTINGYMFAHDEFQTVFDRRFCSTDVDAEEDSPFSSVDLPAQNGVISTVSSANLRMNEFYNRVELDTWFTADETKSPTNKFFISRLGYNNANILLQEDGAAILQEDGFFILL